MHGSSRVDCEKFERLTSAFCLKRSMGEPRRTASSTSVLGKIQLLEWDEADSNAMSTLARSSSSNLEAVGLLLQKRALLKRRAQPDYRDPEKPSRAKSAPMALDRTLSVQGPSRLSSAPSGAGVAQITDIPSFLSAPLFSAAKSTFPAAPKPVSTFEIDDDLQLTEGRLRNGVRYLVRPNSYPSQEIQLRVVVDAGSLNEEEDELGLVSGAWSMVNARTHAARLHLPARSLHPPSPPPASRLSKALFDSGAPR